MAIKINLMPKKEASASSGESQQPFYSLILLIIFIIAAMVYAGVYYYNAFMLQKQLDDLKKQNAAIQENISKSAAEEEFPVLSAAIVKGKSIQSILSAHFYGSKIYQLLEKITIKSIKYDKFSQKINSDDTIGVTLSGEAESFAALTKQLIVYKKTKEIKEINFSGASINKNGKAAFTIDLTFNSDLAIVVSK